MKYSRQSPCLKKAAQPTVDQVSGSSPDKGAFKKFTTPPAAAAIAAWAALDGCPTATTRVAPHIAVTTYPCGAQLVTVNGGGHTWPGGAPVNPSLGVTTSEYDATATIPMLV